MSLSDHPLDIIDESSYKLCLISDLLCHSSRDCKIQLSQEGFEGLLYFLLEIGNDLRIANADLVNNYREVQP